LRHADKHWAERLLDALGFERHDIGRPGGGPLLTRWVILGDRFKGTCGKLYVHVFWRSDPDDFHDHPWNFWSLILHGGYWEWTPCADYGRSARWYGPLSLLRRPAEHRHKVEVPPGKTCTTLVSWGFWCKSGVWVHWTKYADGAGCPEEANAQA
jgi:hypothetical protein